MREVLKGYLVNTYRRDVLGVPVNVETPEPDPELVTLVKAECARIDAMRLGASLVNRDFASYHHKRTLEKLLRSWE